MLDDATIVYLQRRMGMIKIINFFGLWGVSADGVLCTPKGKKVGKFPKRIAFFLHNFLNYFTYLKY